MGRVLEGSKAERFEFIKNHFSEFGIRYLCCRLGVTFQGYYQWLERGETVRDIENRRILSKIRDIYERHNGNYGSPRVYWELRSQGENINHKRARGVPTKSNEQWAGDVTYLKVQG